MLFLCVMVSFGGLASSQAATKALRVDADSTLALEDGAVVVPAGLRLPPEPWLAGTARQALERLALDAPLQIVPLRRDRYGRVAAEIWRAEDASGALSFNASLVRSGAFLATPDGGFVPLERVARQEKQGLWADPAYAPRASGQALDRVGRFAVVEGRAVAVTVTKAFTWINFGADWRRDFTIEIPARARRAFAKAGVDPATLRGRQITATGLVEWSAGPKIIVSSPDQLAMQDE